MSVVDKMFKEVSEELVKADVDLCKTRIKEICDVDIQNEDGTYKSLYQILNECYNNIVEKEKDYEQTN